MGCGGRGGAWPRARVRSRVVRVDVDAVQDGLGQGEDVDHASLQDVAGLREELVEAPALGLLRLQDVGQDGHQLVLQTPAPRGVGTVRGGARFNLRRRRRWGIG